MGTLGRGNVRIVLSIIFGRATRKGRVKPYFSFGKVSGGICCVLAPSTRCCGFDNYKGIVGYGRPIIHDFVVSYLER